MATLWITEYEKLAEDFAGQPVLVGEEPALVTQQITYTTSVQSAVFHPKTRFIRVKADADAHLKFGKSPTAVVGDTPIEANVAEYFGVRSIKNEQLQLAVYDGTT